ncbi:MAG: thiamine phosphate synthase [Syntrophaceae bacterium]|nr:thiamine phosphate synthase [Syntrophaceae bacterium]
MRGLYLVTDRGLCRNRSLPEVVLQAVQGGVDYVQLREKNVATRLFLEEALAVKKILQSFGVPLIINDRVDVALACGADGIHVGQDDMPYTEVRRLMGEHAIIGVSVETWEDVLACEKLDVNYLGVSPIFATPTKTDTKEPWGMEGLKKIREYSRHDLVAIGGIHDSNAAQAIKAGAHCLAVVSAICSADDPLMAAKNLKSVITENLP